MKFINENNPTSQNRIIYFIELQISGGEGGIRTLDTVSRMPVFKTGAFNHSATSPDLIILSHLIHYFKIKIYLPMLYASYLSSIF